MTDHEHNYEDTDSPSPVCFVSGCGQRQQLVRGHYVGLCALHMPDLRSSGLPYEKARDAVQAWHESGQRALI